MVALCSLEKPFDPCAQIACVVRPYGLLTSQVCNLILSEAV